jgi:hypothetical protein
MEALTPAQARAMCGPEPHGDPDGMRHLASQLNRAARLLDERLDIRLDHWESDAGRRVKAAIAGAAGKASGASCQLRGAAALLEREADEAAAARARWAARYSELINQHSAIPETKI